MNQKTCRLCSAPLQMVYSFGRIPLANVFPSKMTRVTYPLTLAHCVSCGLWQLGYIVPPSKIFPRYGYRTGASKPLITHLSKVADICVRTFRLSSRSSILDIGANDGTLLSAFGSRVGLRVGVDPARTIGKTVPDSNIHMVADFFTEKTASKLVKRFGRFDLITATNTLANIVDLHGFFRGIDRALSPDGMLMLEVGSEDTVIKKGYFDSMYHEHYAYFSARTIRTALSMHGFVVTDITVLPTQGGSLRVFARRAGARSQIKSKTVRTISTTSFSRSIEAYKHDMARIMKKYAGKVVVGFGAPAKAVTLVHVCGMAPYLSAFVDSTPDKQGQLFPGTRLTIYPESYLSGRRVDAVVLFSWNYAQAIMPKLKKRTRKPVDVVIPFPKLKIVRL